MGRHVWAYLYEPEGGGDYSQREKAHLQWESGERGWVYWGPSLSPTSQLRWLPAVSQAVFLTGLIEDI